MIEIPWCPSCYSYLKLFFYPEIDGKGLGGGWELEVGTGVGG